MPQKSSNLAVPAGSVLHDWLMLHWRKLLLGIWAAGAIAVAFLQLVHVVRFRRLAAKGDAAPQWFADELATVAARLSVRPPISLICERLASPMLWCWGRPKLLWPSALGEPQLRNRVCGVIAHELAHLRRWDHWVIRLEMVAACIWWWNPVFWFVRRRIHQAAELACDAWVVWALPDDRRAYAESLVEVSRFNSNRTTVAPALGAIGEVRRNFERRLVMIFQEDVRRRMSWSGAVVMLMLAAVVLPGWSLGQGGDEPKAPTSIEAATPSESEPAKEAETAADSRTEQPSRSESGGWRTVDASAENKQADTGLRAAEPVTPLRLPADSGDTASSASSPPVMQPPPLAGRSSSTVIRGNAPPAAPAPQFDAVILTDTGASYAAPPLTGSPVPALKDLKTSTTIKSLRLEKRDALGVLQILAAVMDALQDASSDARPFVLAFTPASEETATMYAHSGFQPTPVPSAIALAPAPSPAPIASPLIQPPTPGIAPSWPVDSLPSASSTYPAVRPASTGSRTPTLRLAVDVRTNTLIVRGQDDEVELIIGLVARLDSDENNLEESLSESLECQAVPVTHRDPKEISAVLRGLGIKVDLNTLKPGKKAGNTPNESGLFMVLSDSDAEDIAKLIKSLDIEEESEKPTEDVPSLPEQEEDAPDDAAPPEPAKTVFGPLQS